MEATKEDGNSTFELMSSGRGHSRHHRQVINIHGKSKLFDEIFLFEKTFFVSEVQV